MASVKSWARRSVISGVFDSHHLPSSWHHCIRHLLSFFRFDSSRVHRQESVLLHRVAFRILHACSVVFMIMRFPLRVLAIGGVEAGSGKGGRHVSVFFCVVCFHFITRRVLLSFPAGVTLKNIGERKLAGLKNRCGRMMYDLRQQAL